MVYVTAAVRACITAVGDLGGQKVTTIEGPDPPEITAQKALWGLLPERRSIRPIDRLDAGSSPAGADAQSC
jgi:hypothetical protein